MSDIMEQHLLFGLTTGASYSLLAVGLVLVLKTTDVPNFALAAMGLVPTYAAWQVMESGVPYVAAIVVLLASGALVGLAVERGAMRFLAGRPHHITIVMTIGLWYVLNGVTPQVWGSQARSIDVPYAATWRILGLVVTTPHLVALGGAVLMALLVGAILRTQTGLYMRALALDKDVPRLLGVSGRQLSAVAWALSGAIAALAVFLHAQTTALSPDTGNDILISAFVAATIGGFSSIRGALLGGLGLGLVEAYVGATFSSAAQIAATLLIVLAVLIARPTGVLGERELRAV